MGAGAGFRVTLKAKCWLICAMYTLQRTVKQRAVSGAQTVWQALFVHRKTMVLAGNHHHIVIYIFHWMVGAMVTEFHLCCFGARGQS